MLALDSSEVQTHGARIQETKIAKRRAKRKKGDTDGDPSTSDLPSGTLVHRLVRVNPESLDAAIREWIAGQDGIPEPSSSAVHMVALHACGGLTPNILRQFIAQAKAYNAGSPGLMWYPSGLTVVGCCYHLIDLGRGKSNSHSHNLM